MVAIGIRNHPFCGTRFTGNDEVVVLEVKFLQGIGHEGHVFLIEFMGKGQLIDRGGIHPVGVDQGGYGLGMVNVGVYIPLGEKFKQGLKHFFPPPHSDKPIMDNRNLHSIILLDTSQQYKVAKIRLPFIIEEAVGFFL
jgi:hypothetical protein